LFSRVMSHIGYVCADRRVRNFLHHSACCLPRSFRQQDD
jgi:hypothetical protein